MKKHRLFYSLKLNLFIALLGMAAAQPGLARTTADAFLAEGLGARSQGMGGAQTALSGDLPMLYWNPAGLADLAYPGFLANYSPSQENMDGIAAAYGQPVGPISWAVGWIQSRTRDIEITDSLGTVLGEKDFINQQGSLSLASNHLGLPLGLSIKHIQSKFGAYNVQGTGFDLGGIARWRGLSFGAKWQDIGGTRLNGDSFAGGSIDDLIPSRARLGAAWTNESVGQTTGTRVSRRGPMPLIGTLAVDVLAPLNSKWGEMTAHYGGELWYEQRFAVRSGWNEDQGLSFGASLVVSWLRLDYAFLINENFNPTSRVTTLVYFDGKQ